MATLYEQYLAKKGTTTAPTKPKTLYEQYQEAKRTQPSTDIPAGLAGGLRLARQQRLAQATDLRQIGENLPSYGGGAMGSLRAIADAPRIMSSALGMTMNRADEAFGKPSPGFDSRPPSEPSYSPVAQGLRALVRGGAGSIHFPVSMLDQIAGAITPGREETVGGVGKDLVSGLIDIPKHSIQAANYGVRRMASQSPEEAAPTEDMREGVRSIFAAPETPIFAGMMLKGAAKVVGRGLRLVAGVEPMGYAGRLRQYKQGQIPAIDPEVIPGEQLALPAPYRPLALPAPEGRLALPAPEGRGDGFTMRAEPKPTGALRKPRAYIDGRIYYEGDQLPPAFGPRTPAEPPMTSGYVRPKNRDLLGMRRAVPEDNPMTGTPEPRAVLGGSAAKPPTAYDVARQRAGKPAITTEAATDVNKPTFNETPVIKESLTEPPVTMGEGKPPTSPQGAGKAGSEFWSTRSDELMKLGYRPADLMGKSPEDVGGILRDKTINPQYEIAVGDIVRRKNGGYTGIVTNKGIGRRGGEKAGIPNLR